MKNQIGELIEVYNQHDVQIRVTLDLRISKKAKGFDPANPQYPVKFGIDWPGCPRERIISDRIPKKIVFGQEYFKRNWEQIARLELHDFKNAIIEINEIINKMPTWSFDEFKQILKNGGKMTVETGLLTEKYFDDKIKMLDAKGLGKGVKYQTTKNSLINFHGKLPSFEEMDVDFINRWQSWYLSQTNSTGRTNNPNGFFTRVSTLRAIFNMAIEDEVITKKQYPFGSKTGKKFTIKSVGKREFVLPLHMMKVIEDANVDYKDMYYRDLFMFSFYMAGMNLIDIFKLKWHQYDEERQVIRWKRSKSQNKDNAKLIECGVPPQVQAIINRYCSAGQANDYIFAEMKEYNEEHKIVSRKADVNKIINVVIKGICKRAKFEEWDRVTFYIARHTWATNARDMKYTSEQIQQLLGHESIVMTNNYLGSLPTATIDSMRDSMANLLA